MAAGSSQMRATSSHDPFDQHSYTVSAIAQKSPSTRRMMDLRTSEFSEEQIIACLKLTAGGMPLKKIGRSVTAHRMSHGDRRLQARMPGRELVRMFGAGPPDHRCMEDQKQQDLTPKTLRTHASCDVFHSESSIDSRFNARAQDRREHQLTLRPSNFRNFNGYGGWGRSAGQHVNH